MNRLLKDINIFIHSNLEYYSEIKQEDIIKITKFLINQPISIDKFIEMRNVYMYMLYKRKGVLTSRYGEQIIKKYHDNEPIIQIANKYKLPPFSVLYQILIELKYETHIIEKMLIHHKRLPNNIRSQLPEIIKSNPVLWLNTVKCNIYHDIKKIGTEFIYKQKSAPIILFKSTCTFNKIRFDWIEIKKYMIFDNKYLLSDINKTAHKYAKYGNGLVLYSDIICSPTFIKKIKCNIGLYSFFKS
jgi:hypothetical protein